MKNFDKNYINQQLEKIDGYLKNPITLYIIGGAAMSFYDLKTATKDIDVILTTEQEAQTLIQALQKSNYTIIEKITEVAYKKMKTRAVIENADGFRWDIFVNIVCGGLRLSDEMIKRAQRFKTLNNITANLVSPEDIFIFKAVTSRPRDREDMFALFSHGLTLPSIKNEIQRQAELDTSKAWISYFFIGLDELVSEYNVKFPYYKWFLTTAENEMMEHLIVEHIARNPCTSNDLSLFLHSDKKDIQKILIKLQKQGVIINKDNVFYAVRKTNMK